MCILANLVVVGCAVSPADDRQPLAPTGLRDGGRGDDDDDDDEIPTTRRARDAGVDARARSASADSGAPVARPRDAAARADAETDPVGADTSPPTLIPNTPISAPVNGPPTLPRGGATSDRAIADRESADREADARDGDADDDGAGEDERPSTSTSRTRGNGSNPLGPSREIPPPNPRDRSGRASAPRCLFSWDCPASACELTEFACCSEGACGCKSGYFATCRR